MPEDKDLAAGIRAARRPDGAQMVAALALAKNLHVGAAALPLRGNHAPETVHRGFVKTRRFGVHEPAQEVCHRRFRMAQVLEQTRCKICRRHDAAYASKRCPSGQSRFLASLSSHIIVRSRAPKNLHRAAEESG